MLNEQDLQYKTQQELITIVIESRKKIIQLQVQLDKLLAQKYKKRSEKSEPSEFDEPRVTDEEQQEIDEAEEEISVVGYQRKKTKGRSKLPESLPRKEVIHDIADSDKICCCGKQKSCIGEEVSEQLEYIPAKTYVIKNIRKKYACSSCINPGIIIASPPPQPIPKSIASAGLLAQILVSKYCYHLPLYRQEQILKDAGVDIPRATTSSWVIKSAKLLQPLVNLMQDNIISYDISYADETRVQVLKEKNRRADQESFMWCFAGGEPDQLSIVLQYSETRNHLVPLNFFGEKYNGYIHCDGYSGYEAMSKANGAKLSGCMIHARRKFFDITKTAKKNGLSHYAVKIFGKLAKIEQGLAKSYLSAPDIKIYRQDNCKPILDKFKTWLDEKITQVPPEFPISQAIQYTLNQWPKLITYLDDGRLEWSNNFSERIMKMFATGRKNWLFSQSVSGANASAIIYSLVVTCLHHRVDVFQYFRQVLQKIPTCNSVEEFEALLPYNIKLELKKY